MRALKLLDHLFSYIEGLMISTLAILALISGVLQVVLRYVFNSGFHWNEPVFMALTIWAILFASSRAVRDHVHVRVEFFVEILPRPLAHFMGLLSYLSSLLLTSFYFYCGLNYVRFLNAMGIVDLVTGMPDSLAYSIVPIAMGMMALRYVLLIVELFRNPGSQHGDNPILTEAKV